MRRRLILFGAVTTSLVVLAFLVPLLVFVRVVAEDRALANAQLQAQSVAAVAADERWGSPRQRSRLSLVVQTLNAAGPNAVTVFGPDGTQVGAEVPPSPAFALARAGRAFSARTPDGVEVWIPVEGPAGRSLVRVKVPGTTLSEGVRPATLRLLLAGGLLVILACMVGWVVARRLSRPVTEAAAIAGRLASGEITARLIPSGPGEVAELGRSLNLLGSQIGELLAAERELMADLSHRLRTPITALRLDVDTVPDAEQARQLAARVDDLARAVDDVVRTARAPRTQAASHCDAAEVVRSRTAFWAVLAEDQGRRFTLEAPTAPVVVAVDQAELAAAMDALIENVFTHTPEGVEFSVHIGTGADGATEVVVSDDGPGFAASRIDARGLSLSGSTGLGLDIARRCAESAGGSFECGSSVTSGARVLMRFPPFVAAGSSGHALNSGRRNRG